MNKKGKEQFIVLERVAIRRHSLSDQHISPEPYKKDKSCKIKWYQLK
ncbi:MAG TPA: hypothetical protein VE223_01475 [Nitrososphaeraceae archaeon]|nr:hypothetical protein [Nitrososphaeraceae archaeon]